MKKLLFLFLLILLLTPLYPIYAEEATGSSETNKTSRDKLLERRKNLKETVKENVNEFKEERKQVLTEFKENKRELVATKTAALKAAIARFKDKQKALRVERINSLIQMVNEKMVDKFNKRINKINSVLTSLETKVNAIEEGDKTDVNEAIASAKMAIDEAKASTLAQSQKDYTIEIEKESTVKENSVLVRSNLNSDLRVVRQKIAAAREAVKDAIDVAKSTLGGEKEQSSL